MADVTEVIHRITYEVNNDALNNATVAIQLQIAELRKLGMQLDAYAMSLEKLSFNQSKEIERVGRNATEVARNVALVSIKIKSLIEDTFKGVIQGLTKSDGLKDAVSKYVQGISDSLSNLNKVAKESEVGFAQYTQAAHSSASASSEKLSKSLNGLKSDILINNDLMGLAVNALFYFGLEIVKESGILDKFIDRQKEVVSGTEQIIRKYEDVTSRTAELASAELAQTKILYNTATDVTQAYRLRLDAVENLQRQYPDYFGNLSKEAILAGKAADKYMELKDAIIAKATVSVYQEELTELIKAEHLLDRNIQRTKGVANAQKGMYDRFNKIKDGGDIRTDEKKLKVDRDLAASIGSIEKERTLNLKKQQEIQENILSTQQKFHKIFVSHGASNVNHSQKRKQEAPITKLSTNRLELLSAEPEFKTQDLKAGEKPEPTLNEKQKGLTEAQKENIKEGIDGYQKLAQAAADAYNKIIQAQIDALDKEISLREKRVEEAKKLAERGNVEALRLEEERLRKAQEQRARFARQQQIVNSAITVSNAIAAVARAALEGGGFGSAATIAALIAALAAGYAAVSSMTQDTDSFADGVVGYRGKGGPRDDKNWVRISSGESIITAAGTQKNRALLEAINQGAALHMTDPSLPLMMPSFKQPGIAAGAYANSKDLKQLENKLDEVVGAIEDSKLRQNIFFNEQGVGIMTERAIKKERKRWM